MTSTQATARNWRSPGLILTALLAVICLGPAVQAAGPVFWDWPQGRNFADLDLQGAAVDLQGRVVPGLSGHDVGPAGPEVFWTLAADGKGGAYLGSGHGGEIHHLDRDGESSLLVQLEGTEIFSLLPLADGSLLAGCGPDGQLYQVQADGQATLLGTVAGGYVWDLAQRPGSQEVWLAAGSPAAAYRLDGTGKLDLVQTLPAQNCLTLEFAGDGTLLLGTQGPGLVYRLDPDKTEKTEVLFQAPQDEVRQFLRGTDGALHFLTLDSGEENGGTSGGNGNGNHNGAPASLMSFFEVQTEPEIDRSAIYRLSADGAVAKVWASDLDLMIAAWSETWGWLGAGPLDEDSGLAQVHHLREPASHHLLSRWEGGDILDLLVMSDGSGADRVLVAQAHPGNVRELGRFKDQPAVALSPPLDGKQRVNWGRLRHEGSAGLRWSVRGGNSSEPDASWSSWTATWQDADRPLDLADCRYLQWKVEFPFSDGTPAEGPYLEQVSVSAWQDNVPPVIRDLVLEQVTDISLGAMMNGSDNVTQTFRSGLKAEYSRSSQQDTRAEGARAAVTRPLRVFTWQGQDPNGDRLVYRLEYARQDEKAWRHIIEQTEETIGSWDTSEVPDGRYQVRLIASDERDNPLGLALKATSEAVAVVVDNTPPVIKDFTVKSEAGGFRVVFTASDAASSLAGAVIQLPDGSRQRLDPTDRICDSRREKFDAVISWPIAGRPAGNGPWAVRVEVRDLTGNLAVAQAAVAVSGGK